MPRKKTKAPAVEEVRSLREQVEAYIFECVAEFEQISGLRVERIDIRHYRPAGFGSKDIMEVNIRTQNE